VRQLREHHDARIEACFPPLIKKLLDEKADTFIAKQLS
jgi:hypothetical protein